MAIAACLLVGVPAFGQSPPLRLHQAAPVQPRLRPAPTMPQRAAPAPLRDEFRRQCAQTGGACRGDWTRDQPAFLHERQRQDNEAARQRELRDLAIGAP